MNNALAISTIVIKELSRRKDFYVLFIMTAIITLLMGSVNFFNLQGISKYLKEICLLLIWISSLAIALATTARQIPAERENRTIFPLLAKPVTRWEVVVGKFLGCWFACGLALGLFYLFFGALALTREGQFQLGGVFQAWWLHWSMLAIVVAMTLLGSVVFAAPSSNVTIVFLGVASILLLGRYLHKIAVSMTEPGQTLLSICYFAMPHLEFFDVRDTLIHEWSVPWWACGVASLYACCYTLFFLVATWVVFRRQALN
jgi:Cu-processing system permease protein